MAMSLDLDDGGTTHNLCVTQTRDKTLNNMYLLVFIDQYSSYIYTELAAAAPLNGTRLEQMGLRGRKKEEGRKTVSRSNAALPFSAAPFRPRDAISQSVRRTVLHAPVDRVTFFALFLAFLRHFVAYLSIECLDV